MHAINKGGFYPLHPVEIELGGSEGASVGQIDVIRPGDLKRECFDLLFKGGARAYATLEAKRQIAREVAKIKRYKSDKAA